MSEARTHNYFSSIKEFTFLDDSSVGRGSFGVVKLAFHLRTNRIYAIKIVLSLFNQGKSQYNYNWCWHQSFGNGNRDSSFSWSSTYHKTMGSHWRWPNYLYDHGICRKWQPLLISEHQTNLFITRGLCVFFTSSVSY